MTFNRSAFFIQVQNGGKNLHDNCRIAPISYLYFLSTSIFYIRKYYKIYISFLLRVYFVFISLKTNVNILRHPKSQPEVRGGGWKKRMPDGSPGAKCYAE